MNLDVFKSAAIYLTNEVININPFKAAGASVGGALTGQFCCKLNFILAFQPTIFFQHLAWTIAAIAGIISIINGVTKLIDWFEARKKKNEQD